MPQQIKLLSNARLSSNIPANELCLQATQNRLVLQHLTLAEVRQDEPSIHRDTATLTHFFTAFSQAKNSVSYQVPGRRRLVAFCNAIN